MSLDRVREMAAFTLTQARWGDLLGGESPLVLLRKGNLDRAIDIVQLLGPEEAIPWRLLLAWELADVGALGAARRIVRDLAGSEPPILRTASARHAVYLLCRTRHVDPEAFRKLQRQLFDDNDKSDLCESLIEAGDLSSALLVATSIAYFYDQRVARLTAIAKAHARRAEIDAGRLALTRAETDLSLIEDEDTHAERLAAIASAHALLGDSRKARANFAEAIKAVLAHGASASSLARIGQEQAEAGLLDDAEQTAALRGTGTLDFHYPKEILESVAVAAADRGETERAVKLLSVIGSSYINYPRAVRNVARCVAAHDKVTTILPLVTDLPTDERGRTLSAVVSVHARAGHLDQAISVAELLEGDAAAGALVDIVLAPGSPPTAWQRARQAVEQASPSARVRFLARLATAFDGPERDRAFGQALEAAASADQQARWDLLATVGYWQASVGDARAAATFAAARRAKRASQEEPGTEDDRDQWWELGVFENSAGNPAGARESFAEAMRIPSLSRSFATWALPAALVGIALTQARSGDEQGARITVESAMRAAEEIPEDERGPIASALANVFAETGDFEVALNLLFSAAPDEDGWQVLEMVTTKMAEVGLENEARDMLALLASQAEGYFEPPTFEASEPIAALASARATVGDVDGAREVASWDATNEASSRVEFEIIKDLVQRGDADAARELVEDIWSPRWKAKAYCAIASARLSRGDLEGSDAAFAGAVAAAEEEEEEIRVRVLLEVAHAQDESRQSAGLETTLAGALAAADAIEYPDGRDQALSAVVQAQAAFGDVDGALRTVSNIRNLWFVGEAQCMAALAAGTRSRDPSAAAAIAEQIESPWWRAVGQAAVFAVKEKRNDPDAWEYWTKAQQAMNEVPEGNARSRLQEAVVGITLETGNMALALRLARDYTTDRELRLTRLVRELGQRGAVESVRNLLPECAKYPAAAYAACQALAEVVPAHADAIAEEMILAGAL
ncbi:hypothetical protein ACI784_09305 [Geodermatophilus sp. SYSU D01186]